MGLLSRLADLRAALLARFAALAAAVGEFISSCRGHLEQRRQQAWHLLPSRLLTASTVQWLAGVAALATALVYAASLQGIGVGGRLPWLQPQATADAVAMAADIGLPPAALRPLQPAHTEQAAMQARELLQQKKQQQKAAAQLLLLQQQQQQEAAAQLLQQQQQAAAAQLIQQQQAAAELAAAQQRQQQQQRVAVLSKSTASRIVKEWLVSVCAAQSFGFLSVCNPECCFALPASIPTCLPHRPPDPALARTSCLVASPAGHQGRGHGAPPPHRAPVTGAGGADADCSAD